MTFAPSIWALEIDGKPALAFEAKKYREADCHHEWLRLELDQRKIVVREERGFQAGTG